MTLSPAINGGLCPQMTIIDRDLWLQVLKAYHQHATKKCDPGTSRILPPQTLPGREVQHAVHRACLCFVEGAAAWVQLAPQVTHVSAQVTPVVGSGVAVA